MMLLDPRKNKTLLDMRRPRSELCNATNKPPTDGMKKNCKNSQTKKMPGTKRTSKDSTQT
jgi:hypothetical protein